MEPKEGPKKVTLLNVYSFTCSMYHDLERAVELILYPVNHQAEPDLLTGGYGVDIHCV